MRQSFLDSLVGIPVKDAIMVVGEHEFKAFVVPEDCNAITQQARPKTVILWQENGRVRIAEAGDPLELERE